MPDWIGKTLGKVRIIELIARGGMAEVYLGEHAALNRKVAVKIMREHIDADPDNRKRFEREARVVASLSHPNIIQVFDYEIIDGQPCLIMELVPGVTLGSYMKATHKRGERLPFEIVSRILTSLASAIDYAHEKQIIHRDIKPANVLLRSASGIIDPDQPLPADVEPILTDFGLVRLLDSSIQTSTGTVSGTPAYMSPEQARGDKVDSRTDIYSLGVMLYEMLAGVVPFDAESSFGILMKHLNDPPPPIQDISTDLQAVITRALSKDAQFRYETAKEMVDDYIAVFNGQTISSSTVTAMKMAEKAAQPPKPAASFSWVWAGVAAFVVVLLGFFVLRTPASGPVTQPIVVTQTPVPTEPPVVDLPVGNVSFGDQNAQMDKVTISLTDLPAPKAGSHYDVWFLSQGGEVRRLAGSVDFAQSKELVYVDKNQQNVLSLFDQVEVTVEADNDPNPNESSGDVVASSIFPPLALIHVRHVLVAFHSAPNQVALIQGLWWGAIDKLETSTGELRDAFSKGDETLARKKMEEIINLTVGNANTNQYKDWNEDAAVDDPSDGFGLLQNGDPGYTDQGYITQTINHTTFASQSIDATENIKAQSVNVAFCLKNMDGWSKQLVEKTVQLQAMSFGSEMEPLIAEIEALAKQITSGADSNSNGLIEPVVGECGATTAYEHSYYMADMPLLLGLHRIPIPAPTPVK